ncbi:sulfatase-like hydrolase/transferase [Agromyces mangrovi Wang et al. 2018]|uniref:sulfatase-like hydrolase/transferase n=1 Tax=Agromyces mangrovi TaxID=1858653 RepID=UPI00257256B0|nr:sulfatase-like hydrolase/transferase [Agromyces mangrovi]
MGPVTRPLDPNTYSWPRELGRAGYRSQYVGKWHVHPVHDPTSYGYDEYVPLESYTEWRASRHPSKPIPDDWFGAVDTVPTADSRTHWLAARTSDFIREASASDQPWHARLDLLEPHLPCQPVQEFADRHSAENIPPWRDFADPLVGKPYIQRQQLTTWGVEDYAWEDWAPIVARYYAVIEQLDDAIGTVLAALDESGVAEDTLVIYTTDHGDMGGAHRMMDKHFVMYDDVVRVPLLMRWPDRIPQGTVVDAFTYNTLDLPPTISAITGIAPPDEPHGASLLGEVLPGHGTSVSVGEREHVVATYNGQQFGLFTQRMIRTRTWKYVWNPTDIDELYGLQDDPEEFFNRIDDPQCADELKALRESLYQQLAADGDAIISTDWMVRQLREGRKLGARDLPHGVHPEMSNHV